MEPLLQLSPLVKDVTAIRAGEAMNIPSTNRSAADANRGRAVTVNSRGEPRTDTTLGGRKDPKSQNRVNTQMEMTGCAHGGDSPENEVHYALLIDQKTPRILQRKRKARLICLHPRQKNVSIDMTNQKEN